MSFRQLAIYFVLFDFFEIIYGCNFPRNCICLQREINIYYHSLYKIQFKKDLNSNKQNMHFNLHIIFIYWRHKKCISKSTLNLNSELKQSNMTFYIKTFCSFEYIPKFHVRLRNGFEYITDILIFHKTLIYHIYFETYASMKMTRYRYESWFKYWNANNLSQMKSAYQFCLIKHIPTHNFWSLMIRIFDMNVAAI